MQPCICIFDMRVCSKTRVSILLIQSVSDLKKMRWGKTLAAKGVARGNRWRPRPVLIKGFNNYPFGFVTLQTINSFGFSNSAYQTYCHHTFWFIMKGQKSWFWYCQLGKLYGSKGTDWVVTGPNMLMSGIFDQTFK